MRKFKIDRDYNGLGCNIYQKGTVTINPGVTVLVGCNGIGKTTLANKGGFFLCCYTISSGSGRVGGGKAAFSVAMSSCVRRWLSMAAFSMACFFCPAFGMAITPSGCAAKASSTCVSVQPWRAATSAPRST